MARHYRHFNLNHIRILQKRISRIITKSQYNTHTNPLLKCLRLLKLSDINRYQIGIFMCSYHNRILPSLYDTLFTTGKHIHPYNTRQTFHYRTHPCRTNIKQFSILFQRPSFWNSLGSKLQNSTSLECFKSQLKKKLISYY